MHRPRRRPGALLLLGLPFLLTAQEPTPESWVERPLDDGASVLMLLQAAEGMRGQGNLDGARACLLACVGPIRRSREKGNFPLMKAQLQRFERITEAVYAGTEPTRDLARFAELLGEHLPLLERRAEGVGLPPLGPPFEKGDLKARKARVQRTWQQIDAALDAATAYATAAPGPELHLQQEASVLVTERLRTIMITAISLSVHSKLLKKLQKEEASPAEER